MTDWVAPAITRVDEPFVGDERAMLDGFLDWGRQTILVKCAGLDGERLAAAALPSSTLSLLGLVRHLTDVERTWFRRRFAGVAIPPVYWREDAPDAAFTDVDPAAAARDLGRLRDEWVASRAAVAEMELDAVYLSPRWGSLSLRWLYQHMTTEYARHSGHADLLRQHIDGVTGV